MKPNKLVTIPADSRLEVCASCGHVVLSNKDREEHLAAHYESYKCALALHVRKAMLRVYPINLDKAYYKA